MRFGLCLTVVLLVTFSAFGRWALISTEKLLEQSDLVVVARMSDLRQTTTNNVDYGSATLTVSEVLKGKETIGQKLTLKWQNEQRISRRIDHSDQNGKTKIWLLQKSTNTTFTANYPGRVLDVDQKDEVKRWLAK